ncbi:MAG: hypothetical protein ACOYBW_08840 [Fluviibacter phosphoraccumulans]
MKFLFDYVQHDGDRWQVVSYGATRDDGTRYVHLASTTRFRNQCNGRMPLQIADWIDPSKIEKSKVFEHIN